MSRLDSAYSQCFSKIFNSWDATTINQCQFFMSVLPVRLLLYVHKVNYLMKIVHRSDFLFFVFRNEIKEELYEICSLYNIDYVAHDNFRPDVKSHILLKTVFLLISRMLCYNS